jgi:hypothetical protein
MYSEKEIRLAKRYLEGDCNEIQMNYIISTEKLDRSNVDRLISTLSIGDPMIAFAKVILVFMVMHFFVCLFCALQTI